MIRYAYLQNLKFVRFIYLILLMLFLIIQIVYRLLMNIETNGFDYFLINQQRCLNFASQQFLL